MSSTRASVFAPVAIFVWLVISPARLRFVICLVDHLRFLFSAELRFRVYARALVLFLLLQLLVTLKPLRVQNAFLDSRLHRAVRLIIMLAITEATISCDRLYICEGIGNTLTRVPQLQFAHAG